MNARLAQLADSMQKPPVGGYVAERHPLVEDLIIVWAPCGCYWIGANTRENFTTACSTDKCDFRWEEITRALLALEQAEESLKCATDATGPELVRPAPQATEAPELEASTSKPGASPTNSSTTASVPSEVPDPAVAESATTTAAQTAVDQLIEQMISEGGPVVPTDGTVPSPS